MIQTLVDNLVDSSIILLDQEGRVLTWNAAAERIYGWHGKDVIGLSHSTFQTPEKTDNGTPQLTLEVAASDGFFEDEGWRVKQDGSRFWANVIVSALRDKSGVLKGFGQVTRDLTRRRANEEEIKGRSAQILEMATVPIVQVWEGVILVPLIGTLDSLRSQHLMERLLQRIADTNSPIALLDITGVPMIDTETAQHLIETISAVRLLGAEVIMTGVRPAIAQTLVHLGIDLSHVMTRSALAAGLRMAFNSLDLAVMGKAVAHG